MRSLNLNKAPEYSPRLMINSPYQTREYVIHGEGLSDKKLHGTVLLSGEMSDGKT